MLNNRLTIMKTSTFSSTSDPVFNRGFVATKQILQRLPEHSVSFDLADHDSIMHYLESYLPSDYVGDFNFKIIDDLIQLLNTGEVADDGDYCHIFEQTLIQKEFADYIISIVDTDDINSADDLAEAIADLDRNLDYNSDKDDEEVEEFYEAKGCITILEEILSYFK